jgi:hypothetical protein
MSFAFITSRRGMEESELGAPAFWEKNRLRSGLANGWRRDRHAIACSSE